MGFDGSLVSSLPRRRSPNDDVFAPVSVLKALLLLKAPKPPMVGSRAVTRLEGEPKADLAVLPSADVDPKVGLELSSTDGVPKIDVIESDFLRESVEVKDPDE